MSNRQPQMPDNDNNFTEIFNRLRAILKPYAGDLEVTDNSPTVYCLQTDVVMKNRQHLFFAGVRVNKNYVSYHLFPVYTCPELVKSISPELRKRMQGKSCFNFKKPDEKLFQELSKLTEAAHQKFSDPDFLENLVRQ
jgi:hypothetical protein